MTASLEVVIDAVEAEDAASFWSAALGYERLYERGPYIVLGPSPRDIRPRVLIQRVDSVTSDKTAVHIDMRVDDPDAEVRRLEALGATVAWRVDDRDRGGSAWTTMTAPHGTLFCVCPARGELTAR